VKITYALLLLVVCYIPTSAQEEAAVDPDIINDPHFREEHGLNAYTRPSIDEIFAQLAKLAL